VDFSDFVLGSGDFSFGVFNLNESWGTISEFVEDFKAFFNGGDGIFSFSNFGFEFFVLEFSDSGGFNNVFFGFSDEVG